MSVSKELIESVKSHEGFSATAYQDTVGVWTIGYGTNLQTCTIEDCTAEQWLIDELIKVKDRLSREHPVFNTLDEVRQNVLIEMGYNMGVGGLNQFAQTWSYINQGDYNSAAHQMLLSRWASQVGRRALVLSERMRTGIY